MRLPKLKSSTTCSVDQSQKVELLGDPQTCQDLPLSVCCTVSLKASACERIILGFSTILSAAHPFRILDNLIAFSKNYFVIFHTNVYSFKEMVSFLGEANKLS